MSAVDEKRDATGWSASTYNKVASFVYSHAYTSAVLQLLDAKPGERILDLGCGSGELTKVLSQAVGATGVILGVDASESMVRHCLTLLYERVLTALLLSADRESKAKWRPNILRRGRAEPIGLHSAHAFLSLRFCASRGWCASLI